MKTNELKVMYESDEAASVQTVTGWVDGYGRFWGNNEHMARYVGSTHKLCECGNIMSKGYTICDKCSAKKIRERYFECKFQEWDGNTPLALWYDDKFFWDEDDIEYYLEDNELEPSDLMLVLCYENRLNPFPEDRWNELLPEDGELPKEVRDAIDNLNLVIEKQKPISWSPSNIRTEYKLKP
jgi:hypothetical protein